MHARLPRLTNHRVKARTVEDLSRGEVRFSAIKATWFLGAFGTALVGGALTFSWPAFTLFLLSTGCVLLLGHSLGSHRKLIHNSFQCPLWLEYLLVYCGVMVGLSGPLGLMRQHELRDYAQRLPTCHDYLRHGRSFWQDAWWQLCCELQLTHPPTIRIEARVAQDRFYNFLDRTWMLQQVPWALLFYAWGGWGFVFWGVCARITAGVLGHWLIGYMAHNRGGMHHEVLGAAVQGRNVRFVSLLTMGESWHNNHHAYPGSAKLGLYPGEWDPGWWVLALLRRLGLVWNVRLPGDLSPRPELLPLDEAASNSPAASAAMPIPLGLREACVLCANGSITNQVSITWPGSLISPKIMRLLVGSTLRLELAISSQRLHLHMLGKDISGLPALCIAFAQRGGLTRALAKTALPIAVALEQMRYRFAPT